ncbi:Lacal_2735 family protein [Jejudonia soesokkakensis]|uniref:Lacal_2735 family protein n=1 Tax=Jejudonia soesokkakensis TaxID=1323432 RepID=A0ABW2MXQ0_9FLAO
MSPWFRNNSRIEILKKKYTSLMRKSYKMALKDPEESERAHEEAEKIYEEIQYLNLKLADK